MFDPKLHLFLDDHNIAATKNVEKVIGRPTKHTGPVLFQDKPWESPWVFAWGSVLKDPVTGKFQMWYETAGTGGSVYVIRTCYAESDDGTSWSKPDLDIYSFNGYGKNNIVFAAGGNQGKTIEGDRAWAEAKIKYLKDGIPLHENVMHYDGTNVVYDHNEIDPDKRYKWIGCMWRRDDANSKHSHNILTSPDGIHWSTDPVRVLDGINDGTKAVWDQAHKRWLLTYLTGKALESGENIRSYGLAQSSNLYNWQKLDPPLTLDSIDDYGKKMQGHFLVPFAYGDQHIALVSMIHTKEGWCQTYLAGSRDGSKYERILPDYPFITIGGDDEFDADCAETTLGAPMIVGDDLYIYYCGRARRHWAASAATGAIGLVKIKRDRFAGYANGGWFTRDCNNNVSNDGEILTKPAEVTGYHLYVNVKSRGSADSKWGACRAELLDENLAPIPGYSLDDCLYYHGDSIRALIKWKDRDKVDDLAGKKVSIRFVLNMATIYSYTFC